MMLRPSRRVRVGVDCQRTVIVCSPAGAGKVMRPSGRLGVMEMLRPFTWAVQPG